jgi:hypothetical protein
MENLHVGEQTWVYRRGNSVVALNNGASPATVTLSAMQFPADALGACTQAAAEAGTTSIVIPPRSGCVF